MRRYLFEFEKGSIPPAVIIATALLVALFTLGLLVRLLIGLIG